MTEILNDLARKLHDISIHTLPDDDESNIVAMYAVEDAIEEAKTAALVLGIAL